MRSRCLPAFLPACCPPCTDKEPNPATTVRWDGLVSSPHREKGGVKKRGPRFLFWSFHVPPWSCQMRSSVACGGHGGRTIALLPSPNTRPLLLHICAPPPPPLLHQPVTCYTAETNALSWISMQSPWQMLTRALHSAMSPQPRGTKKITMQHEPPGHISERHSGTFQTIAERRCNLQRNLLTNDHFNICK